MRGTMRMVLRAPFSLTPGSRIFDSLDKEIGKPGPDFRHIALYSKILGLRDSEPWIAAGIDRGKRGKVHVDVQRESMVRPPLAHANAQRRHLGAADVDARRSWRALAATSEKVDHRLLEQRHELLHPDAAARKIDQGVDDELAGTVIRDIAAAVRLDHGNAVRHRPVLGALAQRVDRRMLKEPELIGRRFGSLRGERAHGFERGQIGDAAQALDADGIDQRHSTITTDGWSHSSR